MSEERKDGGPAFAGGDPVHGGDPGMSLRDYFAAKAMQSYLSLMLTPAGAVAFVDTIGEENGTEAVAKAAYQTADHMLEARK